MKILITSGGTSEKIDSVRKITNMATGRLGSLIADEFTLAGAEVIYVCAEDAVLPARPCERIIKIGGVSQLKDALTALLTEEKIDCVVHAMAVSDYSLRCTATAEDLAALISEAILKDGQAVSNQTRLTDLISEVMLNNAGMETGKKLSSDFDNLIIFMEKTPKVIRMIKKLAPDTVLVGFKLLVNVSRETLIEAGLNLKRLNGCDFVLCNDLKEIEGDSHKGTLIRPDGSLLRLNTKTEIARAIVENVILKKGNDSPNNNLR